MKDLLTPLIAILAVWIAYQQWRTQHDKLRLDLFDRRSKVFEALMRLLIAIEADARASRQVVLQFGADTTSAGFLFGHDIADYLTEIRTKAVEQMKLSERLSAHQYDPSFDERAALTEREEALLKWLLAQGDVARRRFEPYIGFAKVRSAFRLLSGD